MDNSIEPDGSEALLTSFGIRWQMFKADPDEVDQHLDPFYSPAFCLGDIRDLQSFVKKLTQKEADPVSAWLRSQFDASVQSALQQYNDAQNDCVLTQWILVQSLNKIIKGGRIHDKAPFHVKRQRLLTRNMIKRELHGSDLVQHNRMVLEDQYPELARKHQRTISFPTTSGVNPINSIAEGERQSLENDHAIRRAFLWNFECDAENLSWLADRDQEALGVLARASLSAAHGLANLAQNGHEHALRALVELAEFATENVRRFGTESRVIREMAKERLAWPMLASTRSKFKPEINLKALGLGLALFPKESKNARFVISDPVGRVAFRLYQYVRETRKKALAVAQKKGAIEKLKIEQSDGCMLTIEKRAALLPDFSSESTVIKAWWDVAKICLIEAYPHPTLAGELNEQVPSLNGLVKAKSHRKTKGVIRSKILEKLEDKFYSFGGHFHQQS